MSAAIETRDLHLMRLAVHEVEDVADMLRTVARMTGTNARRYNQAMQGARWLERKIAGRTRIEPIDLFLRGDDWNKIAELCARSGLPVIARKIWMQLEPGD